jgi:predicted GNAT superfamily acetyltransferase
MSITCRDLYTLDDFARVVALETRIWGLRDECVPLTVFAASVPRGAVLVGAFDGEECVGFTYSFPAISHGRVVHWSHMTGVLDSHRRAGVARRLKLAQRERVRALGLDRIDWTFDPLQAVNAHLNVRRLGALVEHYEVNVYGESGSPLHGVIPTDRFIAQWWLNSERVAARLGDEATAPAEAAEALALNPTREQDRWTVCDWDAPLELAPSVAVAIPPRFDAMLATAPDVALQWRLTTRRLFQGLLGGGYRVVDFVQEPGGGGRYLLVQDVS